MSKSLTFFTLFVFACSATSHASAPEVVVKTVISYEDTLRMRFVHDPTFFAERWDTVAQTLFWKQVINMNSDTCLINIAECRRPVDRVSRKIWHSQTEDQKTCFKDSVCTVHDLEQGTNLFITAGKEEFYQVKKTLKVIDESVAIFQKNGCDPWFAQAILLIESPGKLRSRSSAGAMGPFQLMPSVARRYGLVVNKHIDQRTDIAKSAKAASALITRSCIPSVKALLDANGFRYSADDLWFRLLVLHVYHAGAGNVRCVLNALDSTLSGIGMMSQVWKTSCAGFKNEAQNYSQIALGSWMNFEELISEDGDTVYLISGDKLMHEYRAFRTYMSPVEAFEFVSQALEAYEDDFLQETMDYDQFMGRISDVQKEFSSIAQGVRFNDGDVRLKKYPGDAGHVSWLGEELAKRRRFDDAIRLQQLNLEMNPDSHQIMESLSRLYRLTGNAKLAEFYSQKSQQLAGGQ